MQLDYSSHSGTIPTLRQMIMSLNSRTRPNTPIFHCVDMDWQEDGFTFQYLAALAEEAEITLNTLLPLLQHHFPDADVGCNFTCAAEERCRDMVWDESKNMIVDAAFDNATAEIGEEENLVGFEFATEELQQSLVRPTTREDYMPNDNDSVSTFRSRCSYLASPSRPSIRSSTANISTALASSTNSTQSTSTITSSAVTSSTELTVLTKTVQEQGQQVKDLQSLLQQLLQSQSIGSSTENNLGTRGAESHSGDEP